MSRIRVLIVDDDERIRTSLSAYLRDSNFDVTTAASCAEARRLNNESVEVALLDLMLLDGSGLDLLSEFRSKYPDQTQIMISGEASLTDAVEAVKRGAVDFLEKPLGPEKVEITIRNALRLSSLSKKLDHEKSLQEKRFALIGESPAMRSVLEQIDAVSRSDSNAILLGESGTGKEVVANLIHLKSTRRMGPFVAVNTAAIPAELLESEMFGHEKGAFTGATQRRIGRLEQAAGGTLFLDEIGEMPSHLQSKLLRVLEDRLVERVGGTGSISVDFRLVCATNRNLAEEVRKGKFRQDLFFRINVFAIELPALRSIPSDIEIIANHHLARLCERMGREPVRMSSELLTWLRNYPFPGNVRELRNILEHLLIMHRGDELSTTGLPSMHSNLIPENLSLKEAVARFEAEYIGKVLKDTGGNITRSAEILGLDRSYLYRKIKSIGLEVDE